MKQILSFLLVTALSVAAARAADITWVTLHPAENTPSGDAAAAGFTTAPDIGYTQLLTANGHNVTRYVSTGAPDTALLNAADLVIIGRSVPSGDYQDDPETATWNGITAPMMIVNGYVTRSSRLGLASGTTLPDTTGSISLAINDPSHPVFSGIALNPDNTMANSYANIVSFNATTQRGISVINDPLAGGGQVLATVATAGDPAVGGTIIAEWQAGATLATSPADTLGGHRLAFLTGSREASGLTSHGAGIFDLTPDGTQLFLNAVSYMAIPEPSIAFLLPLGGLALLWRRRRA
ncbi:MAG TPA: PEP-CTERM sorting domain-containing protein [Candidatus Paceibacterota bacterium]|nr:PEP-CTERM sorting domain-containing protein [Verrucomicrobiota bacterium]HOX01095.1 PEP-CTERM sorting domain-containing protein [Verrucomicrobiota bacterium]HRZ44057.1 PEP-CTERM sorting domain-containing protein [Candidatus Paceibacterota bacterium]HRZ91487.1 PEP-CTERM sorting domain-containing protein [Candidatus Paceibacterota bacterium]